MNHQEIKTALQEKGLTFTALARASGMNRQSLASCSLRTGASQPAALVIAAGLGKTVEEVFSDMPQYQNPSREEKKAHALKLAKEALKKANIKTTDD